MITPINLAYAPLIVAICGIMLGCESPQMQYSQVELHGLVAKERASPGYPVLLGTGETVVITDPKAVKELSRFFPGLGSGRKAWKGIKSPKNLELVFLQSTGERTTVYTKLYTYWGSDVDQGDLDVKGDLKSYLEALLANATLQKTASTQPKEQP